MISQRRLTIIFGLILVLVACTRPQATPDSVGPLAPPDTLSQPTTTRPAPTTTLDVERSSIIRVDPTTLETLDGYQPLPMGDWSDWYWSDTSDNERWLAMTVGDDSSGSSELRLIDLETWEVVESWAVGTGGPLHVDDEGTVRTFGGSSELLSYAPSPGGSRAAIDLPIGFSSWTQIDVQQDRVRLFGATTSGLGSDASIVVIDLPTSEVTHHPLPEVPMGTIDQIELSPTETAAVDASPVVVWDGARAFVVHAGEDVVTEVDLESGVVAEHRFGPAELEVSGELDESSSRQAAYVGHYRTAALAPDGSTLFVATQAGEVNVTEDSWQTSSSPLGLTAVDTVNWKVSDSLEAPISNISISPDGTRLLGTGYRDTQGVNTYTYESSSYYLIDPANLEVISEFGLEDPVTGNFSPVSYGLDDVAYLTSWGDAMSEIQVIELANGAVLNTRTGSELWILGPVGVLGQTGPAG